MSADKAQKEMSDAVASAAQALGDKNAVAPFFRFPYLGSTSAAEERAIQLGLSIWSADFHASDWNHINAEKVTALALSRLEVKKKGVMLLHDIHERTALAMPVLLRELKKRGYRVVHVVPASVAVAKIEEKPEAKTGEAVLANTDGNTPVQAEQAALASPEAKTPAIQQAAPANPEQASAEKPKHRLPVRLDHRNPKNAEGWRTHTRRSRKVTAQVKPAPLQNVFQAFWQR
jgi:hypothetical protein